MLEVTVQPEDVLFFVYSDDGPPVAVVRLGLKYHGAAEKLDPKLTAMFCVLPVVVLSVTPHTKATLPILKLPFVPYVIKGRTGTSAVELSDLI